MLKNLMVLSAFVMLGGCETLNQESQCDPDKNYVISNPEVIDKYKKLLSNNEIKSIYYKNIPTEKCNWDSCVQFDSEKFEFVEKYFDDKYRKGVYKIFMTNDLNREDCLEHDPAAIGLKNKCFFLEENYNYDILSSYKKITTHDNGSIKIVMSRNNEILFEYSAQYYTNNAVGSYGGGICKNIKNNNPNYEFNVFSIGE